MVRKASASFALLAILCLSILAQVYGQNIVPGVTEGNYFIYDVKGYWSSDNANIPVPEELLSRNQTESYNVTVTSVMGNNVTYMTNQRFNNGSEPDNRLVVMDISSGELYFMYGFLGIFGANLQPGDYLRPQGNLTEYALYVNETVTREYGSGPRATNVVKATYDVAANSDNATGTETVEYYIDKQTGVLVERIINSVFPDRTGKEEWILTETNVWDVSGSQNSSSLPLSLPVIIAIVVTVVVVLSVTIVYITRKGKRRKRKQY